MGNRHPLKAAKIGQITGGGGWAGVRKRRGGGPFSSRLPIRKLKAAASAHNFALSASCQLGRSIGSDAENEVKVIDAFLLERETTENVINTGLSASCSKATYGMSECWSGMSRRVQQADVSHWGFKDNSCPLPPPLLSSSLAQTPFGSLRAERTVKLRQITGFARGWSAGRLGRS